MRLFKYCPRTISVTRTKDDWTCYYSLHRVMGPEVTILNQSPVTVASSRWRKLCKYVRCHSRIPIQEGFKNISIALDDLGEEKRVNNSF